MQIVIKEMLTSYNCRTPQQYKNALKEIMQEVALLGLARQNFFDKASFYGGTALRIAHKLNRFSEDIDFTLIKPDQNFDISPYLKGVKDEFSSLGLIIHTEKVIKNQETAIESAFLKANTLKHLLKIDEVDNPLQGTHKNELIKIKLEIDTCPPLPTGEREILMVTRPIPFSCQILTLSSLFGGKLHALICRQYKTKRVKGRDYYDFAWYINKQISPDLAYLKAKLVESKHWSQNKKLLLSDVKSLLVEKFNKTDWSQAKADVMPFISNSQDLDFWSKELFIAMTEKLKAPE